MFNPEFLEYVPPKILQRIHAHFTEYIRGSLPVDENPVLKIQLVASELKGVLYLDKLLLTEGENGVAGGQNESAGRGGMNRNGMDRNTGVALLAGQHEMRRQMSHMQSQVDVMGEKQTRFQETVNRNVNRLVRQPGRRFRNQGENQQQEGDGAHDAGLAMALNARLSRTPRTLYLLWEEFTIGLGGFKAARLFSSVERGRSKYVYSRRKVAWDMISALIRAGYTADVAIDKIYKVYGESLPVTKILLAMIEDRKNGGHPQLRV